MLIKYSSSTIIKRLNIFKYGHNKIDWQHPDTGLVLYQLKQKCSNQPSFIRDNSFDFINHLLDLMELGHHKHFLKVINQIDYGKIGDWNKIIKIGKGLQKMLHVDNLKNKSYQQKKIIFKMMMTMRYQPNMNRNKNLQQYIISEIKDESISNSGIQNLLLYFSYFVATNPKIFQPYKQTIQLYFINKIGNLQYSDKLLIPAGLISGFWDTYFLEQVKQKCKDDAAILKSLNFADLKTDQNITFKTKQQISRTATQIKIGEFLKDMGYRIKQNCLISGMEVDYVFDNNFLLQYNGIFHYNIAQEQPKPIAYEKWKNQIFKKRKFYRCIIPFYEWERINNQKSQRAYLIQKIQLGEFQRNLGKKQHSDFRKFYKENRYPIK